MFAKLTGTIDSIQTSHAILDVNGVGYLVAASTRTLGRMGGVGDPTTLLIETVVREDSINLFGFVDAVEQEWFNLLCSVQGVGAKAAQSILAVIPPEELPMVISAEDKAAITRADGVGPKIGARIITELKDKAGKMVIGMAGKAPKADTGSANAAASAIGMQAATAANSDAVSALINLGYGRSEAFATVTHVARAADEAGTEANVEYLIRESLKELSA